jgi:hypothetical protein
VAIFEIKFNIFLQRKKYINPTIWTKENCKIWELIEERFTEQQYESILMNNLNIINWIWGKKNV